MRLHPNSALRILRVELERLTDAAVQLALASDDPRIPVGVIRAQLSQCDREIGEITEACMLIETAHEADQGQLPFDQDVAGRSLFVAA